MLREILSSTNKRLNDLTPTKNNSYNNDDDDDSNNVTRLFS